MDQIGSALGIKKMRGSVAGSRRQAFRLHVSWAIERGVPPTYPEDSAL